MATIKDERQDKGAVMYVVFTDHGLSGWGGAEGGRSLYALACSSSDEAYTVLANGRARSEMKRGRILRTLKRVRLGARDHMTIADKTVAKRWYQPGAFAEDKS